MRKARCCFGKYPICPCEDECDIVPECKLYFEALSEKSDANRLQNMYTITEEQLNRLENLGMYMTKNIGDIESLVTYIRKNQVHP